MSWKNLPDGIASLLTNPDEATPVQARLGNEISFVTTKDQGKAVLKVGRSKAGEDMRNEVDRLIWLRDQLPVPRILAHQATDGTEFVLMTLLRGRPAHLAASALSPDKVLGRFARYLRRVHSIPVGACPFGPVTGLELAAAHNALAADEIDREAFVSDVGIEPAQVLSRLEDLRATVDETTFTHGDYCLPNLMVDTEGQDSALDWGLAGISDPHRDLMSAELTISRNFGTGYIEIFYRHYGASGVDRSKIEFYWLLDRFSNHRIIQ